MFIKQHGNQAAKVRIIWLHGWGHTHATWLKLSHSFTDETENYLIDLPGFGATAAPCEVWGSAEYTNALLAWLMTLPPKPTYLVGHSFGGKIALQAAHAAPGTITGIVLIAAAGLPRRRALTFKIKATALKYLSKTIKLIDCYCQTNWQEKFSHKFGSQDYKASQGIMRSILVKSIQENLAAIASQVQTPTLLLYGSKDQDTPVSFGEIYHQLIANSTLIVIPGFDHNSILSYGQHQVYNLISQFIARIANDN